MLSLLRTPRWAAAAVVTLVVCSAFVLLGNWQLRRHAERALENQVTASRLEAAPIELDVMLAASGGDLESLDFRRVTVTGTFAPAEEVLLRGQVANERSGFHIVTPFVTDAGTVLVDRGWVPLAADPPPVEEVPPPTGVVTIEGVARTSQARAALGPTEPAGRLRTVARIDLERLSTQFDDLLGVWVQETDDPDADLPVRAPLPIVDDPGPHLAYAAQWYIFALIGAVGFTILLRRNVGGAS